MKAQNGASPLKNGKLKVPSMLNFFLDRTGSIQGLVVVKEPAEAEAIQEPSAPKLWIATKRLKFTYIRKKLQVKLVGLRQVLFWRAAQLQLPNHELREFVLREAKLSYLEIGTGS